MTFFQSERHVAAETEVQLQIVVVGKFVLFDVGNDIGILFAVIFLIHLTTDDSVPFFGVSNRRKLEVTVGTAQTQPQLHFRYHLRIQTGFFVFGEEGLRKGFPLIQDIFGVVFGFFTEQLGKGIHNLAIVGKGQKLEEFFDFGIGAVFTDSVDFIVDRKSVFQNGVIGMILCGEVFSLPHKRIDSRQRNRTACVLGHGIVYRQRVDVTVLRQEVESVFLFVQRTCDFGVDFERSFRHDVLVARTCFESGFPHEVFGTFRNIVSGDKTEDVVGITHFQFILPYALVRRGRKDVFVGVLAHEEGTVVRQNRRLGRRQQFYGVDVFAIAEVMRPQCQIHVFFGIGQCVHRRINGKVVFALFVVVVPNTHFGSHIFHEVR